MPALSPEELAERALLAMDDATWKAMEASTLRDSLQKTGYAVTGDPVIDELERRRAAGEPLW